MCQSYELNLEEFESLLLDTPEIHRKWKQVAAERAYSINNRVLSA